MAKQNNTILWIIVGIFVVLLVGPQLGLFTIGEASMTRSVPSTVQPGQQFNVIYTTSVSGKWGASIIDNVLGGCKFPDGSNQLKTVMLSTDGNSKIIKVIAPSSGSCTFSGDYKFGTEATKDFIDNTITITTENGNGDDNGNGDGNGEETVCCKIIPPPEDYQTTSYKWTTKSYCEEFEYTRIIVDDSYCENGNGNGNGEITTFDLNQVLFKLGNFEVTILILLISLGAILLLLLLKK